MGSSTPRPPAGYQAFYSPHDPAQGCHGGSAIFISSSIPFNVLPLNSPLEMIAGQLHLQKTYTFSSIYLPPNTPVVREDFTALLRLLPPPFLLLGDFNGRHHLWGDTVTNSRGVMLAAAFADLDLCLFNSGEATHYHGANGSFSVLDLSVCSPDVYLDFSWRVTEDLCGSDHYPIVLKTPEVMPSARVPRWRMDRADWTTFRLLAQVDHCLEDFGGIDEAVAYFTALIRWSAEHSIPQTSGTVHRRPVPWWSEECRQAVVERRRAFGRYKRHKTDFYRAAYKQARARARRTLKEARRASFRSFLSSLTCQTPMSKVWKRVRRISGKYTPTPPPVLNINGTVVAEGVAVANTIGESFAHVSRRASRSPAVQRELASQERHALDFSSFGVETYNVPFTLLDVLTALSTCNDTSPGPDGIPYAMLRHLPDDSLSFLLNIYNAMWRNGFIPPSWKASTIIPIPKPGKDPANPLHYRPIALTSCLIKVFEKMVNVRLVWFLEKHTHLSPVQYGFRRARSTTDALVQLESTICRAFAQKRHVVSVFFDLEKAYDTTWRYGILHVLHSIGLRGHLPLFLQSFLRDRTFRVRVGTALSRIFVQEEGVPQGSVLSVTLFGLAINGIAYNLPPDIHCSLYVDDLSISYASPRLDVAERHIQLALNRVTRWADSHGFHFSPAKTLTMHFSRVRGAFREPDLYLYGNRLPVVEQTRFLGVIFDSRLTWVPHLKDLKAACSKRLSLLRVLSSLSWGADRTILLRLYQSLVQSKLDYGCEVYSSATLARLKTLDSIHHAGVRLATGAFRTCPIPSLLVDAGMLPLDLHRQSIICRLWFRAHANPGCPTHTILSDTSLDNLYSASQRCLKPLGFRVRTLIQELSLPQPSIAVPELLSVPPWEFSEVHCCRSLSVPKASLPDSAIKSMFLAHSFEHEGSIPVFTDGSKSDAGVGYGAVFTDFTRCGTLPAFSSIFTAELSAIILALRTIYPLQVGRYVIFSDSRAALSSVENRFSFHPLVLQIFIWLLLCRRRGHTISLCWVPAHVSVEGNERADEIAKAAARRPVPPCSVPYRDLFPSITAAAQSVWQARWEEIRATAKMGEIAARVVRPWPLLRMRERRHETVLTRLRTGHTHLTHSYLMSRGAQPYCDDCLVPLTVRHLLVECPSLRDLREQYLPRCRGDDGTFRLSLILGEMCLTPGHEVLKFVEEAGLLHKL